MISTRGRYSLRIMLDLAERPQGLYTPLKDVAARQEMSLKYIEKILPLLTKAGFIEGVHGRGGGYRLCRAPEEISVGEVLRVTEGELAPVSCLESGAKPCERAAYCKTLSMWQDYHRLTQEFFDGISLAQLLSGETAGDYVI